jgi:murein DD-endopeptidase MepM/ murein hydrolase activator NlpD
MRAVFWSAAEMSADLRREEISRRGPGGSVSRSFWFVVGAVVIAGLAVDGYTIHKRREIENQFQQQVELACVEGERIRAEVVLPSARKMPSGENFAGALQGFGLTAAEVNDATAAAQRAYNLRQLRAGNPITVGRSVQGELRQIDYKIDAERMLHIVPQSQGFSAEVQAIPTHTEIAVVSGQVDGSLFNAVEDAGESPEIAMRLAQIFGYDLDFYTDPRRGDTFRVVLEKKKYDHGETAGYGKILAAEYVNGSKKYQALLFHDPEGRPAYYTADGKSLQKAFLRSPLKFGAPVTSHFSQSRFHPILKTYRAHLGTDYGAPTGTPVQTIGSGRVEFAGRKGGDGNMVRIAHSNGYETYYLHLSKIFVHAGEHVEIGKTIGLVGMTGLATGPHLDFRIAQKGQFKNFETLGLPPSEPVNKKNWAEFAEVREKWMPVMEQTQQFQAQSAASGVPAAR